MSLQGVEEGPKEQHIIVDMLYAKEDVVANLQKSVQVNSQKSRSTKVMQKKSMNKVVDFEKDLCIGLKSKISKAMRPWKLMSYF